MTNEIGRIEGEDEPCRQVFHVRLPEHLLPFKARVHDALALLARSSFLPERIEVYPAKYSQLRLFKTRVYVGPEAKEDFDSLALTTDLTHNDIIAFALFALWKREKQRNAA